MGERIPHLMVGLVRRVEASDPDDVSYSVGTACGLDRDVKLVTSSRIEVRCPACASYWTAAEGADAKAEDRADLVDPERKDALDNVLCEVRAERVRQAAKHGDQSHLPDGTGPDAILLELPAYQHCADADDLARWAKARTQAASQNEGGDGSITFEHILTEEWAEAIAERDPAKLRAELIQVAAVAVQWVEAIDRRMTPGSALR